MAQDGIESGKLTLQVVTPSRLVLDSHVSIVTLPGKEGDFGVLAGHMPLITLLQPGVVDYKEGGVQRKLSVSGGVVEVTQDKVLLLARTCEKPDEIDEERANRAKKYSEDSLSGMSHDDESFARMEVKLKRALSRLKAKN
jgi:F-type H+-transporting ATPase subunit epsilon